MMEKKFNIAEISFLKGYVKGLGFNNTLKAIDIAEKKHAGSLRKSGEPYISHPIRIANTLITLGIDDEEILNATIMHDSLKDTDMTKEELSQNFSSNVVDLIVLLTRVKGVDTDIYFNQISKNPKACLIKIADRCHNISTMSCFSTAQIKKYITETEKYIIPLCKITREEYPEWSNQAYIIQYQIESLISLAKKFLNVPEVTTFKEGEIEFLKGYVKSLGLNKVLKAINIAEKKHAGVKRKSGEPYISHPIRIANAFMSLGIIDEEVLIAIILHDVVEDTETTKEDLLQIFSKEVVELIMLLTKVDGVDHDVYYNEISKNPKACVIKIADRCHNVSTMNHFSVDKIEKYVKETEKYVLPLCEITIGEYPEWSNQVYCMGYQIESLLELAKKFLEISDITVE